MTPTPWRVPPSLSRPCLGAAVCNQAPTLERARRRLEARAAAAADVSLAEAITAGNWRHREGQT